MLSLKKLIWNHSVWRKLQNQKGTLSAMSLVIVELFIIAEIVDKVLFPPIDIAEIVGVK